MNVRKTLPLPDAELRSYSCDSGHSLASFIRSLREFKLYRGILFQFDVTLVLLGVFR